MLSFLVCEFEKNLFAFGVLEPFPVLLEEAVGAALAADADEERLLIVGTARQSIGAFGEQSVGCPFEEQKRRPRFELRIALEQLVVAPFELAEMLLFFLCQVLEYLSSARIAGEARRAAVKLETAALGRDGNAQGVAREQQILVSVG